MLLGNRFYDPSIGRFLSSDPAEDGSNWYAYVDNSPTGFVDPEGLFHLVATIDPETHMGILKMYADPGDVDEKGRPYKPGQLVGKYDIGNLTIHPDADPDEEDGGGPFPLGTYVIDEILYRKEHPDRVGPTKGPGTIKIGKPGQPVYERGDELHGGRGSHKKKTKGCIRMEDDDWLDVAGKLRRNKKRKHRLTVENATVAK